MAGAETSDGQLLRDRFVELARASRKWTDEDIDIGTRLAFSLKECMQSKARLLIGSAEARPVLKNYMSDGTPYVCPCVYR